MIKFKGAFGSYSVDDQDVAEKFYEQTLGFDVKRLHMGVTELRKGDSRTVIYPKPDHQPATFTVLNLAVDDVKKAVDELSSEGIKFERYEGFEQDDRGIAWDGDVGIAWFKDPAGNTVSVVNG